MRVWAVWADPGSTAGSARLAVIPRATKEVLTSFVQGAIRPKEATVHTDAWASYTALSKMGIDHRPRKGGHGRHAVDGLPWAHTIFGNLKTWLPTDGGAKWISRGISSWVCGNPAKNPYPLLHGH
jgi:hypothetical protein